MCPMSKERRQDTMWRGLIPILQGVPKKWFKRKTDIIAILFIIQKLYPQFFLMHLNTTFNRRKMSGSIVAE